MSNPFEYIKNERTLKAERELQEQMRKEDEEKIRFQRLENVNNTYQPIVTQILTDLRDAAYSTTNDMVKQSSISADKLRWSIGRNRGKQDEEYWVSWVDVTLEIDQNINPKGFLCKRLDLPKEFREAVPSEVHAGLSAEGLIASLQMLYPPGS
jgi:hypothetical protein